MLGLIGQFVGLHGGTDSIVGGGAAESGPACAGIRPWNTPLLDSKTNCHYLDTSAVTMSVLASTLLSLWIRCCAMLCCSAFVPSRHLCATNTVFPVSPLMAQINKDSFVEVKTSVEPKKALFLYSSVQYWLAHRSSRPWLCSLQYAVVCLLWRNGGFVRRTWHFWVSLRFYGNYSQKKGVKQGRALKSWWYNWYFHTNTTHIQQMSVSLELDAMRAHSPGINIC